MFYALLVLLLAITIWWLVSIKTNSYKNDPMVSLGLDLEEIKIEKRMRAIENQVALRHALDKGVDPNSYTIEQLVEQYKADNREECIQEAMKQFNLNMAEAIKQGFDKSSKTFIHIEANRRKASKKLGRDIPWKEFIDMEGEKIRNSKYPGTDCWEPWQAESYVRGEELMKSNASHLESCAGCQILVSGMRPDPELQKPPGPDCITEEELEDIRKIGVLSKNRRKHLLLCKRCKSNVYTAQEKFINRIAPDPTPWGMDELD